MRNNIVLSVCAVVVVLHLDVIAAEEPIRVATYNIKYLDVDIGATRLQHLQQVIADLGADIIGLQEIDDRQALEKVFPPNQWNIIIDDDSGNRQDLALVARKDIKVLGFSSEQYNADDGHFLFPESSEWRLFPNRRDVLCVEFELPVQSARLFVMVHHAKARMDGRPQTDWRRAGAARELIMKLEADFDEANYVLLGDFNDSPDDRSMNILESGNPDTLAEMENGPGTFLLNLTEPLFAEDRVSFGRNTANLIKPAKQVVDTVEPGARDKNFEHLNEDVEVGDCLFDQILIPVRMQDMYVTGSAKIFDKKSGVDGNEQTRASDHLPVYADFEITNVQPEPEPSPESSVRMISCLPNPDGEDRGREQITLANSAALPVALAGWTLRDTASNIFALTGEIPATDSRTITLPAGVLPLNNDGDVIELLGPDERVHQVFSYTRAQARPGQIVNAE